MQHTHTHQWLKIVFWKGQFKWIILCNAALEQSSWTFNIGATCVNFEDKIFFCVCACQFELFIFHVINFTKETMQKLLVEFNINASAKAIQILYHNPTHLA